MHHHSNSTDIFIKVAVKYEVEYKVFKDYSRGSLPGSRINNRKGLCGSLYLSSSFYWFSNIQFILIVLLFVQALVSPSCTAYVQVLLFKWRRYSLVRKLHNTQVEVKIMVFANDRFLQRLFESTKLEEVFI